MDKSFNDQELSDIMKEIEALEEDFKVEDEKIETSSVIEELSQADEKIAIPVAQAPAPQAEVFTMAPKLSIGAPKGAPSTGTSMSFKVSGDLNLSLEFDIGGKAVCLDVSEKGLTIQMEGGMTFTVPLTHVPAKKAA